jgi:hypothetical protein
MYTSLRDDNSVTKIHSSDCGERDAAANIELFFSKYVCAAVADKGINTSFFAE